jgi:signal transduction histidine kinase
MDNFGTAIGRSSARILGVTRILIAPVAASLYLTLWIFAELGRDHLAGKIVLFSAFAVVIGISVALPRIALALGVVVVALQLTGVLPAPDETTWPASLSLVFAVFFVGVVGRGRTRWLALGFVVLCAASFAWMAGVPSPARPDVWASWTASGSGARRSTLLLAVGAFLVGAVGWVAGRLVGGIVELVRRDVERASARLEKADLDLRLAEDRARISRDVHDSLAHSLAVIVSQSQGAAALSATRPEVAGGALEAVGEVARAALGDVRSLVERIQGDGDLLTTTATVADVPDLVETMRSLGMDVDLVVSGRPLDLSASQQVAVYRIVQESLTNALKHAGPSAEVTVGLDGGEAGLALTVESRGGAPLVESGSRGIGIEGMKERARVAGGWLRAAPVGPSGTSRFVVTAFVPRAGRGVLDA